MLKGAGQSLTAIGGAPRDSRPFRNRGRGGPLFARKSGGGGVVCAILDAWSAQGVRAIDAAAETFFWKNPISSLATAVPTRYYVACPIAR